MYSGPFAKGAADIGGSFGIKALTGAGAAGGLGATLATGGISMALTAAPKLLEGLFANDKANRQRASQRKQARMAHRFKAEQLKASYQNQYNKTDA